MHLDCDQQDTGLSGSVYSEHVRTDEKSIEVVQSMGIPKGISNSTRTLTRAGLRVSGWASRCIGGWMGE